MSAIDQLPLLHLAGTERVQIRPAGWEWSELRTNLLGDTDNHVIDSVRISHGKSMPAQHFSSAPATSNPSRKAAGLGCTGTLRNEDGRTALSWAARNGRQAVKLVLDTGEVGVDRGHEAVVVRQYSSALNVWNHVHECYAYVKADLTRELPPKYTFGRG